ncbi:MAG: cytochrome P450, partial [Rhodobacteraceae bacterium]|nr:cytochrome P450 [Paracoccaceae bacterium]
MPTAPSDPTIQVKDMTINPYPVYRRLRAEAPVMFAPALNRTLITKAVDTRAIKDNPALFSSNDPTTPMERAFEAHTLMRKDDDAHLRERNAMMPTFAPKYIKNHWLPMYDKLADEYLDRLPKGEVIDLFPGLAGPIAAKMLGEMMGIPNATDEELQRWSQALIDGAGNFGYFDEPFARAAQANIEINNCIRSNEDRLRADPDPSALSMMINVDEPIEYSQIIANIKIAIGGGINEPRDALLTILYGLLTNPDQLEHIRETENWELAFQEGVRWVAPIQVSGRVARDDTMIQGIDIPKGTIVMVCQASANHDEDVFQDGHEYNVFR